MRMLLKNARVIDPANNADDILDIRLNGNVIFETGKNLKAKSDKVINLDGYWLTPGLIDMHTHLRDPGGSAKETIETGTAAARAGGYTTVCCMANTNPVIDNLTTLEYIVNKSMINAKANVWPIAAVTVGLEGKQLTNMAQLIKNGAVAFSDDGKPIINTKLYKFALQYSAMFDVPIISHPEDTSLSEGGIMNEGYHSTLYGIPGIPAAAENIAVAREIELLRYTGGRLHFAHISTARSVELIRRAKNDGLNVTCETAPHYFSLTDESLKNYDTNFIMNPPLKTSEDVEAIKQGLADGTIDVIATDHAPHTVEEKALDIIQAPNGIIGLETSLGLILTNLVQTNILTPLQAIACLTSAPAKILNMPRGNLSAGSIADISIIDPALKWVVESSKFQSKSRNTPFEGYELTGKAVGVFRDGILHYDGDNFNPYKVYHDDILHITKNDKNVVGL
ncbi:MAG: dihydroorotase [Cyanobacteriota bacterium]